MPNSYATLGFCTGYAIAALVLGYNINITCIKDIKALYNAKKSFKKTLLRGMDEFLEAEGEAATMIESEEEETEDAHTKCLRSTIAKHP